jgi:probable HAF family extracellular repeat protein
MNHLKSWTLAVLPLVAWSGGAFAQTFTLTDIGSLGGSQGAFTNWGSMNANGEVVGYSYTSGAQQPSAFIYSNGTLTAIATALPSEAYGINTAGQVTGYTASCGFVDSAGTIATLGTLVSKCGFTAGDTSVGVAINTAGNVAGYASAAGGATHAAYFSDGRIKDLGTLGGANSFGYGINDGGQVVGYSLTPTNTAHAFLSSSDGPVDLGTLGGDLSTAYAINNSGVITGNSTEAGDLVSHPFIYSKGVMKSLGGLGGTAGSGLAIDANGTVVGYATTASGASHAFATIDGKVHDLNALIVAGDPLKPFVTLTSATGISGTTGAIVANGSDSRTPGVGHVYVLNIADTPPTVTANITGTQGADFWYVTPVTLSWTVTGYPTPTTSGCGTVQVPNTTGTTYTCTATNSVATRSVSATIKEDTVPPVVTITSPTNGQKIKQNTVVDAAYTCSDATSGVASCTGTVANGAPIATSVVGTQSFTVVSTDAAGNQTTQTVSYVVGK